MQVFLNAFIRSSCSLYSLLENSWWVASSVLKQVAVDCCGSISLTGEGFIGSCFLDFTLVGCVSFGNVYELVVEQLVMRSVKEVDSMDALAPMSPHSNCNLAIPCIFCLFFFQKRINKIKAL
jgi:hypothetical protein